MTLNELSQLPNNQLVKYVIPSEFPKITNIGTIEPRHGGLYFKVLIFTDAKNNLRKT